MNTGMVNKGIYVGNNGVQEIGADAFTLLFIEKVTVYEILSRGFKNPQFH
jgi:hypothetical protein